MRPEDSVGVSDMVPVHGIVTLPVDVRLPIDVPKNVKESIIVGVTDTEGVK